jgi:hypothetical protein
MSRAVCAVLVDSVLWSIEIDAVLEASISGYTHLCPRTNLRAIQLTTPS